MTWNLVHQQLIGKIVWYPIYARRQISMEQISTSSLPSEPVQQCFELKLCSCDEAAEKQVCVLIHYAQFYKINASSPTYTCMVLKTLRNPNFLIFKKANGLKNQVVGEIRNKTAVFN